MKGLKWWLGMKGLGNLRGVNILEAGREGDEKFYNSFK